MSVNTFFSIKVLILLGLCIFIYFLESACQFPQYISTCWYFDKDWFSHNEFEEFPSFGVQYMSVTLISSLSNVLFPKVTLIDGSLCLRSSASNTFSCPFLSFQEPLLFQQLYSCRCSPNYPVRGPRDLQWLHLCPGTKPIFILGYQRLYGLEEAKAKLLCPKGPIFLPKLKVEEWFLSCTSQCQDIFYTN